MTNLVLLLILFAINPWLGLGAVVIGFVAAD